MDYCIWVNEENRPPQVEQYLLESGMTLQNEEVGMILHLQDYEPISNSQHEDVSIVSTLEQLEEYSQVLASNWTPPDQNVLDFYRLTSGDYLRSPVCFLLHYLDGQAVCTGELYPSDTKTIGFYGFATLAEYRGRGIGSSLMTYALNRVKQLGFKNVILQGTEDGLGIYKRYGFKPITRYFEYA